MKKKIIISTIIAYFLGFLLGPPDSISQLTYGVIAALLCCAALLILARFKFVKSSPSSMQIVVCILVCIVSVSSIHIWMLYKTITFHANPFPDSIVYSISSSASYAAFSIGNLWIVHSSNRIDTLSEETEYVVCSVDFPSSCRYDGTTWIFSFESDDTSTGFSSSRDDAVWIDKQHNIKHLETILSKEDVSLLRDHRYDEEFEISSPEELLNLINKLKDENLISGYENGPNRTRGTW